MTYVEASPNPVVEAAADLHRFGVHLEGGGVDVAVRASRATRVDICFFDGEGERNYTLQGPILGVWHGHVPGIRKGAEYGLRVWGRWDPERGQRHNPAKLLLDPYARGIAGTVEHGPEIYDYRWNGGAAGHPDEPSTLDSAGHTVRGVVLEVPFSAFDSRPRTPWEDTVIYETHVKGMTMTLPGLPDRLRGTYAGLAHPITIGHLQRLGVTAVELLPIHAYMPEPSLSERGKTNYWGYNTLSYFSPEPSYATTAAQAAGSDAILDEFKGMVSILHDAGIEVLLDVVYNHTCEGGHGGPTLSWRGLDAPTYYVLNGDGTMVDYTGCGNSLDFQHTPVVQMTLDSLRYWVTEVGVDGFRFDLAPTMGRRREKFSPHHACLVAMATDPVLRDTKLITEPWDLGPSGWRTGQFPAPMADWNDRFRSTIRQFWLADANALSKGIAPAPPSDLGNRLSGSADLFGFGEIPGGRGPMASVNYVTAHDGFTMRDLTSYNMKHNLANGEDNQDGTNDNRSWNHGFEGDLTLHDPNHVILPVRRRSVRNLIGTLLVSAGTPMILGGDEIGRTQQGNNNAYCQDNEISWFDWDLDVWQKDLFETFCYLIQLRRENPALRPTSFASGRPPRGGTLPDLSWWDTGGNPKHAHTWHDPHQRALQMLRFGQGTDRDALVVFNGSLAPVEVKLAEGRGLNWELAWDSEWEEPEEILDVSAPDEKVKLDSLSMRIYLSCRD
ncbi:MAG TPA: glycogen debranching protein GlgX [Actinomycetaceae bacterium]|nr:glycogen debranching protein GlgX [Actinomycetaceae bacterium]